MNVRDKLIEIYGPKILNGTALRDDYQPLLGFLAKADIRGPIVEIGTWKGASTVLLAQYANLVITFDPYPLPMCSGVWERMGVAHKIRRVRVPEGMTADVSDVDFDFAFIDGDHHFEQVVRDFEAVRHCGKVMFHDYAHPDCPGVTAVVDALDRQRDDTWGMLGREYVEPGGSVDREGTAALWLAHE